jgi:hypothetical protein
MTTKERVAWFVVALLCVCWCWYIFVVMIGVDSR